MEGERATASEERGSEITVDMAGRGKGVQSFARLYRATCQPCALAMRTTGKKIERERAHSAEARAAQTVSRP